MSNNTPDAMQGILNNISNIMGGGFTDDGWAGLDPDHKQQSPQQQFEEINKRYLIAKEIAAPFTTKAGQLSLQRLKKMAYEPAFWDVMRISGYENACGHGIFREGQRSFVDHIEQCIELVKKGPPTLQPEGK